jgi:hypothetical protein
MPCPYASALGVPGEGFHAQRLGAYALNDVLGTLALAGATTLATRLDIFRSTLLWFALAEAMHYAFGVHTAFLEALGLVNDCENKDDRPD